jgi:predicted acylesterase/phospholipase RssA
MGKVVDLKESDGRGRQPKGARQRIRRRRGSKTALVLGGGGFTGGVYEIGALRAFDLLAVNRTVNQFDIFVGTSAGAFVSSAMANGISPEEMMRVLNKRVPSPIDDPDLGTLLKPNYGGFLRKAALFPLRIANVTRQAALHVRDTSMMDVAVGLAEGLPPGLYSNRGIEEYVEEVLSDSDRTNDFRELEPELYITATDLDTTERLVLGEGEWADVPISEAVAASGALPMVYEPVEINGRTLVDGGLRSTTNVDVAVEHGAKFIVVVNPLVPFENRDGHVPSKLGRSVGRISDMGLPAVGYQAFRVMAHARLHEAVARWQEKYPGVDIILIEPDPDDELMFGTSILDFRARLEIAKHGFESVTVKLAKDYHRYKEIAARHGIEISATRVNRVLEQVVEPEEEEISAWRRVLEQTTGALLRQSGDSG